MNDVRRLTADIASGDPEAFARFYRTHFDFVFAVAARASGFDEQSCLDVVQDAMMRVIRYMRPFDDADALSRWVARVTRSVAFDHLRMERRRRSRERVVARQRTEQVSAPRDDLSDRIDWLRRELRGLDRVTGEIIELRFRAGLTLAAIGRRLGLGTGAVHGRLTRGLARLQKKTAAEVIDE